MTLNDDALTSAHLAVEDELVELRDARISLVGPANGFVIREKSGEPSTALRMGTREGLRIGIEAYLAALSKVSPLAVVPQQVRLPKCVICGESGEFFDSPTGSWWSHTEHPDDDHDFRAVEPDGPISLNGVVAMPKTSGPGGGATWVVDVYRAGDWTWLMKNFGTEFVALVPPASEREAVIREVIDWHYENHWLGFAEGNRALRDRARANFGISTRLSDEETPIGWVVPEAEGGKA